MSLKEKTKFMQEIKTKMRELTLLVENWEIERTLVGDIIIDENTYIREDLVANFLDIHPRTISRRAKDGELPYAKFGRTTMYKIKDIRKAIDKNYFKSTAKGIEDVILGYIRHVERRIATKINE